MKDIQVEMESLSKKYLNSSVLFCQKLIQTPSLPGQEKAIADLYLREMEYLGYDEVFRDDWGNVVGIINGTEAGPTIMYNSHLDHVDIGSLSEWEGYDPYGAVIDESLIDNQDQTSQDKTKVIHGRAASDVKGGGATQIYSGKILLKLRALGIPIKGRFVFAGVVLEEPAEQLGMIKLIDETFKSKNISINGVVSSEATSLKVYLGHRGRVELKVTVQGSTAHGSAPWLGINAVNKATKLIEKVEEVIEKEKLSDPDLGHSSIALTNIQCYPGSMCIVPDTCIITYDRRFLPCETVESCVNQMQQIIDTLSVIDKNFKATVEVSHTKRTSYTGKQAILPNVKDSWKIEKSHPFVKKASSALESIGECVKYGYWDFGTDLSKICAIEKIPAIGYSPMQEQYCHRPTDKVRIDYMEKALRGNVAIYLSFCDLKESDFYL